MVSTLQQQARALGDPTRFEIFRYIGDAEHPVEVAELTEHLGLNHNAIRQHLAKLVDAGLLSEDVGRPSGVGRPRLRYVVHPTVESRWGVMGPYQRLALWLTEILRTGETPVEVGRRVGRRQELGLDPGTEPLDHLVDQMARHGFEPTASVRGTQVNIRLNHCPFTSTALADPDTVCQLHLGIAYGIAEQVDGLTIEGLVPRDPRSGNCRLRARLS